MKTVRPERVASMIRQELARILLFETKDPGLQEIVVTGARVSADLRIAWSRTSCMIRVLPADLRLARASPGLPASSVAA